MLITLALASVCHGVCIGFSVLLIASQSVPLYCSIGVCGILHLVLLMTIVFKLLPKNPKTTRESGSTVLYGFSWLLVNILHSTKMIQDDFSYGTSYTKNCHRQHSQEFQFFFCSLGSIYAFRYFMNNNNGHELQYSAAQ